MIPPDFNLRPPLPGAAAAQPLDPSSNAEVALFSNTADPQTVGREHARQLHAGREDAAGQCRGRRTPIPASAPGCNADQRAAIQNADRSFTDRILSSPVTPDNGKPVNADAEVNKGRKASTPKKESGGWFDWF